MIKSKKDNNYKIAPWVSARFYRNKNEKKIFISNEKSHSYYLFEDESAEIIKMIMENKEIHFIFNFAREIEVLDDLEDFFQELKDEAIIVEENTDIHEGNKIFTNCGNTKSSDDIQIEKEMMEWVEKNGFLWALHLDLTYKCNEKCIHCFNPNSKNRENEKNTIKGSEMSTEEIYRIIDEIIELGVFRLIISGGEPTLRKDFFDIIAYARKKYLCVEVYSNGLNFNENFIEKICKYYLHSVGISLYSYNQDKHEEVTQVKNSYIKTIEAIKRLTKKGITTKIKSVQLKNTINGVLNTLEFCKSLSNSVIIDFSLIPGLDSDLSKLDLSVSLEEFIVIFSKMEYEKIEMIKENNIFDKKYPCDAGRKSLAITPFGDVYPCVSFPLLLGNIKKEGLKNIFFKSNELQKWKSTEIKDFYECGKESYCEYCPEICAGASLLESGNYLNVYSNSCKQAKARKIAKELIVKEKNIDSICRLFNVNLDFGRE